MDRRVMTIIFLILGSLSAGFSSLYRLLITSDIPISYTVAEAVTVQVLFFFATLFFLLATTILSSKGRGVSGLVFATIFIFNLYTLNYHSSAVYFDSSYAQLQISGLLHAGLVMGYNFILLILGYFNINISSHK